MLLTSRERQLCRILRDLPAEHNYRYDESARSALLQYLFRSLAADNDDFLRGLFGGTVPHNLQPWSLREAQGLVDGAEYSPGARGRRCGHIFKNAEAIFRCRTCEIDDTSVLCSHCFNASEHTGHIVSISNSSGNAGCCDCGDPEAWKSPVICAIHAEDSSKRTGKTKEASQLPDELLESIRMTIGRTFDYICDVVSCSPEQLRLQKTDDSIRNDEQLSHLASKWYEEIEDPDPEFALILWNDEKHTVDEVTNQVARACKREEKFGRARANETNDTGRSVVTYSKDVNKLLKIAKIIEQIKITVTIRSSRDTFREQMCGTMIEWLQDIDGCSVGSDHALLRNTICEEILKSWRTGSAAVNSTVGKDGLDDQQADENEAMDRMTHPIFRGEFMARLRPIVPDSESDAGSNDNDIDDGDDEADSQVNDDEMDIDVNMAPEVRAVGRDLDMRTSGELEDPIEISEATYAGYPPPPPPPPPPPVRSGGRLSLGRSISNADPTEPLISSSSMVNVEIPRTPTQQPRSNLPPQPPSYWLEQPEGFVTRAHVPLEQDLRQRIRLDWLILFDLRLWKKTRTDLRELYIQTVVTVPNFKRILGLRFAGLYTVLSQLYLIADREPDHSIIHLSTQMLTTASITEEIVERGNFLTTLIAILYTFLTRRQVGHPWEVSVSGTLAFDAGSVTNRRLTQPFLHLKHLLDCEYVQGLLRTQPRYALQFLDLVRLPQGICPNVRAVGEHVEYETDTWITASLLTRDINKLCRVFSESFVCKTLEDLAHASRVIRTVAKATINNATGAERLRFSQAEIKTEIKFKTLQPFDFESVADDQRPQHSVVDFVVESEPISFHHPLHYTLSWLIGQAKSLSSADVRRLLHFTVEELREAPSYRIFVPDLEADKYLLALFDSPLRVCAWLAQMKAGMWVRNGLSLRHQQGTYRGVGHRDLAHNRDIFLLQTAVAVCDPSVILASMIDRFGMDDWMRGNYVIRSGFETNQQLDVAEDFIHLMIILLSDRTLLQPLDASSKPQTLAIRRDLTHILCFKPIPFSELYSRLSEKVQDAEEFQKILEDMTNFKAPEGLSDSGTFELKPEYLADVDPYIAHYSKNQRDEAENAYRTWAAKVTGQAASEIVLEPKLQPIQSGLFKDLAAFTKTLLFAQIIYYSLSFPLVAQQQLQIPDTRLEAFLQVVLHLTLAAVIEDERIAMDDTDDRSESFVLHALCKAACTGTYLPTIFSLLVKMLENEKLKACHPKIRLVMHRLQQRRPRLYASAVAQIQLSGNASQRMLLDRLGAESPLTPLSDDSEAKRKQAQESREAKKRQALDRQAKIMANFQQQQQIFEKANQENIDWGEDDPDVTGANLPTATEEHKKTWKYPADNCLVCQEEVNESRLYGTFALIMNSNIFRQTNLADEDFVGEVLSTPASLDRSADGIRPFGVAGRNREHVRKLDSSGEEVLAEYQGLGKGFPSAHTATGPISTGCGHVMHYKCFETFSAAAYRRQNHQIARNHPERLKRNEFVCPLCKALGNTFLPILWKGKEEMFPGVLQVEVPFDDWLVSGIGLALERFKKQPVGEDCSRPKEIFIKYTSKAIFPSLATKMIQAHVAASSSAQHANRTSVSGLQSMPGNYPTDDGINPMAPTLPPTAESIPMQECLLVYQRLKDTIKVNELSDRTYPTKPAMSPEDLIYTDTLPRTLGYSIAATEIAQRGTQAEPGMTLLDKIPSLVLTHLRILSETASSYIAVGGMRTPGTGTNRSAPEFSDTSVNQLLQLFGGHPQIVSMGLSAWGKYTKTSMTSMLPAISQDPFVFLVECSVCLGPAFNLEIHHLVRLCYLMELVKVVLCLLRSPRLPMYGRPEAPASHPWPSNKDLGSFVNFVQHIHRVWSSVSVFSPDSASQALARRWYNMVRSYASPFLRKVTILLHVQCGLDIPNTGFMDIDAPELERMTRILRLPALPDMFSSVTASNSIGSAMLTGWIQHWRWSQDSKRDISEAALNGMRINHPVIFELIGLPKAYDVLTAETMKRRCPTTGKELSDPVLCLFCGAIFCSQANCCCMKNKNLGGCSQHMKNCSRNVGLFINIRKCNVLFVHDRNGSWHTAPYLDQYGEVDPSLKHQRQLFLNQRRYDALLRNVWLQHGIPTTISRKLESDINSGGWETL
ncbi:E3 ubiquitin-protein ligase ubr1 [Xanthoria calcicola]